MTFYLSHQRYKLWPHAGPYVSQTEMEYVRIDSSISHQLYPSNVLSIVWWMVIQGWDWYVDSEMVTTTSFWVRGGVKRWLGLNPLFTPRLSDFVLTEAIHTSLTLPISHYIYDKWLGMVEIWVHHVYSSIWPFIWVTGGTNLGPRPIRFKLRWSMLGLIQAIDISSTLPMSYQ